MDTFTSGAFLVSFALLLGASNTLVGLIAAVSPLTQLLQIPAIYLVDRAGSRMVFVVCSSFLSRISWLLIALIPWLVASDLRLTALFACLILYFSLGSISACGFNSWIRDFVPEKIMGRYFSKRLAIATAAAAVGAVLAGVGLEIGKWYSPSQFVPYSILFMIGGISGLAGVRFIPRIPEPRTIVQTRQGLLVALGGPFRDRNFLRLLMFLGTWFFAINLSGPFYAVYMIKELKLSIPLVVGLSVVSQVTSIMSFRIWGRTADIFSNKSVLFVSAYMYIATVLLWPLLALFGTYFLTIPLLVAIHALTGISAAGLNLCTGNIALKAAPLGKATAFLAVNTLVHGLAAATAPVLGGIIADGSMAQQLGFADCSSAHSLPLSDPASSSMFWILSLFFLTAFLGLFAIYRLNVVHEDGEMENQALLSHLAAEVKEALGRMFGTARLSPEHVFGLRQYPQNRSNRRQNFEADKH